MINQKNYDQQPGRPHFFLTSTQHAQGKATTGKPGSPNNILCLLSVQTKLAKSQKLTAYSLAYL